MKKIVFLFILICTLTKANAQVELFSNWQLTGTKKTISADWSASDASDTWNDAISSIKISDGWEIVVYSDTNFGGTSMVLNSNWSVTDPNDIWNDKISSIRVRRSIPKVNPEDFGRVFSNPNAAPQRLLNKTDQEIRANVDWIFGLDDNPDVRKIRTPVILETPAGRFNAVRGLTGGKSCGCIALLYALVGKREAALSWLNAAQSHNQNVINLFSSYPDYTLNYVTSQHRNDCNGFAIGAPHGPLVVALYNQLSR